MTRLLSAGVIAALAILVLAGTAAAATPPVPYFGQCDSRWGSDKLGGDGPTICSQGCALTSAAMVMAYYGVDTDPERLNDAIGRGGYDATYCIYWSAIRNACHDETKRIEYDPGRIAPFDETVLNTHLDLGRPVIVYVYCPGHGGYWGNHFVVVTGRSDGTYYINDPGFKTLSTLDAYPTRHSMHIFSGNPPDINKPLVGDWDNDGIDTTGIYNYTTANFSLDSGLNISFGISGDIPITGDWNGNGYDTIGVFRPSTAQFFLDYNNDGVSDMNATFGVIGDIPVVGDWDGDGDDNIGVFRQNHSDRGLTMFFLDFDNSGGLSDMSVAFGEPDDLPVIGDWDGDGDDNIGLYRPGSTTGVFYLDIDNDGGTADIVTPEYGDLGDVPIAGDWDGDSNDNIGVYRPGTGEFFLDAGVPDVSAFDPADWLYSDLIAIQENSGSDLVDYQILVELNTSNFDFSKALSDGADIRFAELDGTLLSYWLEDWNSTDESAKVWVKVPSIPANGVTTIRMWYGNLGAGDVGDGDATFEFFDDFDKFELDYNKWNRYSDDDACEIINGILKVTKRCVLYSRNEQFSDAVIQTRISATPYTAIDTGALFRCQENFGTDGDRRYQYQPVDTYLSLLGKFDGDTDPSPSSIYRYVNGNREMLNDSASNFLYANKYYTLETYFAGQNITQKVDMAEKVLVSDDGFSNGYVGLYSNIRGEEIAYIDHFFVRQHAYPEPTVGTPLKGDLNGDNQITPADAAIALAIAAGGSASCDAATLAAADVSGDGRVTSLDALMILQAVDLRSPDS